MLEIDGIEAAALLARFGSPLNVVVEHTVRANYRRLRAAFAAAWPAPMRVLYSIKANTTLAIRAVLAEEGAGGDCFGLGELHATLVAGTDPATVAMNGSNKTRDEIEAAITAGVTINIGFIADACRDGRTARVNLRLKLLPAGLNEHVTQLHPTEGGYVGLVRRVKWGHVVASAVNLVERLRATPGIELAGYTCHVGHLSARPEAFAAVAAALGQAVRELRDATGFTPTTLDLGGGWAPERDPAFRRPGLSDAPIEAVANATATALRDSLPRDMALPELWVEPGRLHRLNAVVLLAQAGEVKRDLEFCWMHVDASTNNLARIETGQFHYPILPASRMQDPCDTTVEVVGGTCFRSVIGAGRALPAPKRGDIVAILDAGAYAEVFATQFNSVPRPATVLLSAGHAELVRERETLADVFCLQRIPDRLARTPA